ncbi:hypothetical protein Taro_014481 [Colocasia esculenta]|uniref:Uncharacterized protein n=1 Tax=Colocasia esculenta TaxID=4460 RepID=A0A843UEW0_COLES|nr:hypothetical protein [Colocasia esculenta]
MLPGRDAVATREAIVTGSGRDDQGCRVLVATVWPSRSGHEAFLLRRCRPARAGDVFVSFGTRRRHPFLREGPNGFVLRVEVVTIAWDPHPRAPSREVPGRRVCSSWQPSRRTLELRGNGGLDGGVESFAELSWLGLGHQGRLEFYPVQASQSFSHCLALCGPGTA